MPHEHHQHAGSPHQHTDDTGMADVLELDARINGRYLTEVPDRLAALVQAPTRIADLGAGTGAGTIALAKRFDDADIIAVDSDPRMLDRITDAANHAGLGNRIHTLAADLDDPLPAGLHGIDLAWASSSLHHVADPDALLRSTWSALNPGGAIAVVEIDRLPAFLPAGTEDGALEDRVLATAVARGWNHYPDWTDHLTDAGFTDVTSWPIDVDLHDPPAETARYARILFARMRSGLADDLTAADRDHLDRLLSDDGPASVLRRTDLSMRARRTAWLGQRT